MGTNIKKYYGEREKEKYHRNRLLTRGSEKPPSRMINWSEDKREELDRDQSQGSTASRAGGLGSRTLGKCPYLGPSFPVLVAGGPTVYEANVC